MDEVYGENVAANNKIVYSSRIFLCTVAGACAGVLGLEGFAGLAFFAVVTVLIAVLFLLLRIKGGEGEGYRRYFRSWTTLVFEGVFQGLFVRTTHT